jgi:type II secretory pathway pseudopilin PulG
MHTGQEIVVAVVAVATILLVLGLFVWAAIKDGQEDEALQKRLRIRRRTRLGR